MLRDHIKATFDRAKHLPYNSAVVLIGSLVEEGLAHFNAEQEGQLEESDEEEHHHPQPENESDGKIKMENPNTNNTSMSVSMLYFTSYLKGLFSLEPWNVCLYENHQHQMDVPSLVESFCSKVTQHPHHLYYLI